LIRVGARAVSNQMRVLIRPPTSAVVVIENARLIPVSD
jgi:hypothetical protein